jgi:hypothetical protein
MDIMLAVFAAMIHLPIQEKPVQVVTPQTAS